MSLKPKERADGPPRTAAPNLLGVRLRSMVDVAAYLGVSRQRVTQMVAKGKLPASRRDHSRFVLDPERE